MVSGAKTVVSVAAASSTQPICPAVTVPCISPRTAVTRWVIGLTSMNARNQDGMVCGSTKTLLAKAEREAAQSRRLPVPFLVL